MTEINESGGRATGHGADTNRERVSLADILDRRVALDWVESVAIVAGLCSVLEEKQTSGVPAAGHIVLTTDGNVRVESAGLGDDPAALPRLLHELCAVVPPPMPVRLFMLHAISSDSDKSPASFGEALAYYERPGREALIQNARQKCLDTPLPLPGAAVPETAPEPDNATPHETSSQSRHRGRLTVACLGMGLCAVAVVMTAGQPRTSVSANGLLAEVGKAGQGVALAIQGELAAAFGGRSQAVSVDDTTTVPEPPDLDRRSYTAARRKPAAAANPETAAVSTGQAALVESATPAPAPADVNAADDTDGSADAAPEPLTELENAGLVAPRLMDPVRLPPWVDPVNKVSMNAIELEISTTGTVKRVRMLSPALRMTDMMMLSAAKTWLFEPASMNGQPVSYLLTLGVMPNR